MKKILLGTTALVGAALVSQAALADAPKVTVGGSSQFEAAIVSDDQDANSMNHGFYTRNEVSFKVDGKSDAGLGYGSEIWLQADTSGDLDNRGTNATRTFIYLDGMWGRVELGANYGADDTLKVDAGTIARATGGINGDWRYFANNNATGGSGSNAFITSSDLPVNFGATGTAFTANEGFNDGSTENLNKITYYTPKWSGFQAGISYAPNDQQRGQIVASDFADNTAAITNIGSTANDASLAHVKNIWQAGINYTGQWDQIGFALSATAERGDATVATHEDLWAYALGAKVTYLGFSVAGSYGDWNDSLRAKADNADDSNFWTVGGAYEYGPYGLSVTYINSDLDGGNTFVGENEFRNIVVGLDYKLAPGLTPYAEVAFYDLDAVGTGSTNDSDGHVLLLGTQLNF